MIIKRRPRSEVTIQGFTEGDSETTVIDRLREIWVSADAETINDDLAKARELAASVPESVRREAEEFVRAMERLGNWLRSG